MRTRPEPPGFDHQRADSGFSLIEVLVAALLLMVIALGLIPLFTRAMLDNANGRDATTATNFDRSQLETLNAIPFDFAPLAIAPGQTVLQTNASYSRGTLNVDNDSGEAWVPGIVSSALGTRWTRRTNVRQFNIGDLSDGVLDNPLPGDSVAAVVQLKEIEVSVQGANPANVLGNVLGGGPRVSFRILRSF